MLKFEKNNWISWDGKDRFSISLDTSQWAGKVCGLCGNMNGNPLDDMTPRHSSMQPLNNKAGSTNSQSGLPKWLDSLVLFTYSVPTTITIGSTSSGFILLSFFYVN